MVKKSTFIITIIAICVVFVGILTAFLVYHFSSMEKMKNQKEQITILEPSNTSTGLENVIVE